MTKRDDALVRFKGKAMRESLVHAPHQIANHKQSVVDHPCQISFSEVIVRCRSVTIKRSAAGIPEVKDHIMSGPVLRLV